MRRRRDIPLWLRLLWRRLRSPEGRLAPLAVLSIAISVTLATGLEMSSRSAQRQVEETAAALTGSAQIEVVAGEVGVPEPVLETVRAVPGVRAASPMVTLVARVMDRDLALNIVGVDLVAEEQVQRTAIERQGLQVRDALRLLATPDAVVVTRKLLDRLGLAERWDRGERTEIRVRTNKGESTLVVQGTLEDTGIAAAFDGQVAVMDVFSAQALARREGLFDRIDVIAESEQAVPELIDTLNAALTSGAVAQKAQWRTSTATELLEIVRRAAVMFAAAAALVAALLTYATTAQWVERQRRQLATLRAVGMEAYRVRRGLFVEIGVLAVLGTGLGLVGGVLASPPVLSTLTVFLASTWAGEIDRLSMAPSTLWAAAAVGLVGALAGGILPTLRASQRFTLDALDAADAPRSHGAPRTLLGASGLVTFAVCGVLGRDLFEGAAIARLAVMFVSSIVTLLALSSLIADLLRTGLRANRLVPPVFIHLVARSFRMRPLTFGVALAAIASLAAAQVASFLLVETIGTAAERWTTSRYSGAVTVTASPLFASSLDRVELLSPKTVDVIRAAPGVEAVAEHYRNRATVLFRGQTVRLLASTMDVLAGRAQIASVGRPSADLARDLAEGAVAVSLGFQRTFGIGPGDELGVDTHVGRRTFRVAGLFEDFAPSGGSILFDLKTFDAHWQRKGAWSVSIWIGGTREPVTDAIRRQVGSAQELFFYDADELAAQNREGGEVFRGVLDILGGFLSVLGGLGVMILLVGIVAEQRRDLAVLRASGAEPSQLVRIVLCDAAALGFCGAGLGLGIGYACASPATDVLRDSWGWILEQAWFAREVPLILVGAVIAAMLGASLPARIAYKTLPDEVFGPE